MGRVYSEKNLSSTFCAAPRREQREGKSFPVAQVRAATKKCYPKTAQLQRTKGTKKNILAPRTAGKAPLETMSELGEVGNEKLSCNGISLLRKLFLRATMGAIACNQPAGQTFLEHNENIQQGREDSTYKEVLDFLLSPESYPHKVDNFRHIETHISHVFLTGEFAYKLKKPVHFDFIDLRSRAQRRFFCTRELELNSRYAPEIYKSVLSISKLNGKLTFSSSGEEVEVVLCMTQFEPQSVLSELLLREQLTTEVLVQTTDEIAAFHRKAELAPDYGSLGDIAEFFGANIQATRILPHSPVSANDAKQLEESFKTALEQHSELISKRQRTHVRAVHGDLHLGNICIFKEKPTLFDGLEFSASYSCTDTWADIAFLIMDLTERGHPALAQVVTNRYLEQTDDFSGLALLEIFMSYRATVRGKVMALEYAEAGITETQRQAAFSHSASYFQLAKNLLEQACATNPQVIAIGGLSGSGKSTLAARLSQKLGAIHIRSDVVRKHLNGASLVQVLPEACYTPEMNERTYAGMLERAHAALKAHKAVIIDAVFIDEAWRVAAASFAKRHKVPFSGFWCEAPYDVAVHRLKKRKGDASDADATVLGKQLAIPAGTINWTHLDTTSPVDSLATRISEFPLLNPPA